MADDSAQYDRAVDEYLTRDYDGDRRRTMLRSGGWQPELAAELADLGWYALAVPEAQDGLGGSLSDVGGIFVQSGRHLLVGPLLENVLLPALLQRPGDWDLAVAIPNAVKAGVPLALVDPGIAADWSHDVGSIVMTGNRLDGSVAAVRFADQASLLVVIADSDTGSVVCLVDPDEDGVHIEALSSADPAIALARVELSGVRSDAIVPVGSDDSDLITRIRAWSRLFIACELTGLAQGSLEVTVNYLKQREQFDRPIGSFQALKHIAADMHTRWAGLHNLCLAALTDADSATPTEFDILAMSAKAHAAETAVAVCEDAIQLHGGIGFTTEREVSWFYKRALALRAWYGDELELHRKIGAALLFRESSPDRDRDINDAVASKATIASQFKETPA